MTDLLCHRTGGTDPRCGVHGGAYLGYAYCTTWKVLERVAEERARQFRQYGTNADLEDGTGPSSRWLARTGMNLDLSTAEEIQERLRTEYEEHERRNGKPTWMHLVREEVAEAFQEDDPRRLAEELLQVAALCVSWVEKLEAR